MKNIRIYRNAQPTERMVADDTDAQRIAREKMADAAVYMVEMPGYSLQRHESGVIEESAWVDQPTSYNCEECGHSQPQSFNTCPGCRTTGMVVKREAGWQYAIVEV